MQAHPIVRRCAPCQRDFLEVRIILQPDFFSPQPLLVHRALCAIGTLSGVEQVHQGSFPIRIRRILGQPTRLKGNVLAEVMLAQWPSH